MLSNIRIVLIETSHPGNIGGVARAMKNMCLDQLCLVSPQQYPNAEATARASGADDLLATARVCDNLDEALQGCHLVIGTSARTRRLAWPLLTPPACAEQLIQEAARGPVALLFGREQNGLSNEELERCHYLVHIPCNPDFSSLNIAAAAQVLSYEILKSAQSATGMVTDAAVTNGDHPAGEHVPVSAEEMARLYAHLQNTLIQVDFLDPQQPKRLMRRLKRLFNRAQPDCQEVNILRGILTAVERALHHPRKQ